MRIRAWLAGSVSAALLAALAACQSTPAPPVEKTVTINDFPMQYVEQGQGETVVLVHGAISDLRIWDRQRALLAPRYRTVAITQRYFGTAPWGRNWPPFGQTTHAEDLAAFIRALNRGPVHLVAWSYSGQTVLDAWVDRNRDYDLALQALYTALDQSGGNPNTVKVQLARAAERRAWEQLPPDRRTIIVIVAEVARGGLTQAVLAIDDTSGRIDDALAEANAPAASGVPGTDQP